VTFARESTDSHDKPHLAACPTSHGLIIYKNTEALASVFGGSVFVKKKVYIVEPYSVLYNSYHTNRFAEKAWGY